jgi:hypothetical protein
MTATIESKDGPIRWDEKTTSESNVGGGIEGRNQDKPHSPPRPERKKDFFFSYQEETRCSASVQEH